MNSATGNGANYTVTLPDGWSYDGPRVVPFTHRRDWHRPVTPAHALAFLAICASAGFAIGIGVTAVVTAHLAKKARDALGL